MNGVALVKKRDTCGEGARGCEGCWLGCIKEARKENIGGTRVVARARAKIVSRHLISPRILSFRANEINYRVVSAHPRPSQRTTLARIERNRVPSATEFNDGPRQLIARGISVARRLESGRETFLNFVSVFNIMVLQFNFHNFIFITNLPQTF